MKKNLLILFLLFVFVGGFSQTKTDTKDAVNARKVAFITKEMALTTTESEKLWPIYNEFEQKKEDLRKERIKANKKFKANKDKFTEKESEELIDNEIEFKKKETELLAERHKRLKKVLSMKKIALLYKSEDDFKMVLLKDACENLKGNKPKPNAGGDE